jgi:hypothetical protein
MRFSGFLVRSIARMYTGNPGNVSLSSMKSSHVTSAIGTIDLGIVSWQPTQCCSMRFATSPVAIAGAAAPLTPALAASRLPAAPLWPATDVAPAVASALLPAELTGALALAVSAGIAVEDWNNLLRARRAALARGVKTTGHMGLNS